MKNGFVARTTIVAGRRYAPKKPRDFASAFRRESAIPDAVGEIVRNWRTFRDCKSFEIPELYDVPVDETAFRTLAEFDEDFVEPLYKNAVLSDDPIAETAGRIGEKCWKYALLFAASTFGPNESELRIDVESVENAIRLARYELELFAELKSTEMAENATEKTLLDVKKWIASLDRAAFTKSQFTRRFQRLTARERDDVLSALVDGDYIERVYQKDANGRNTTTLFIVNDENNLSDDN